VVSVASYLSTTPPERWMTEPSIAQCPVCVASLKAGADIDAGPDTPTNSPR
jgi:hypothetical protein